MCYLCPRTPVTLVSGLYTLWERGCSVFSVAIRIHVLDFLTTYINIFIHDVTDNSINICGTVVNIIIKIIM